jgi:Protein of unknown function (DUF664)
VSSDGDGTNLLGLVKHLATLEAWYFGEVFGRDGDAVRNPDLVAARQ